MNTLRIDKLQCRKYKLFWICWGAIAVWMIACIVNTIWLQENQTVLDTIGVGVMTFVIISISSFLYDVYKIADFERQQEQMICDCSWIRKTFLCVKNVHCYGS